MLVNSVRHKSWQVFYDLLTEVHLIQSRSDGFHPARTVSNSWTENNWRMFSWLCTRTSLHILVLLPSAFQKPIPVAFGPLSVVILLRDHSQPGNKGWFLCQPQLSGRGFFNFLTGHNGAVHFPRMEDSTLLHTPRVALCLCVSLCGYVDICVEWMLSLPEHFGGSFVVRSFSGTCTLPLVNAEYYLWFPVPGVVAIIDPTWEKHEFSSNSLLTASKKLVTLISCLRRGKRQDT